MPEAPGLYLRHSVIENLQCFADLYEVADPAGRVDSAMRAVGDPVQIGTAIGQQLPRAALPACAGVPEGPGNSGVLSALSAGSSPRRASRPRAAACQRASTRAPLATSRWFAPRWAGRSGEWADRLNSLPKYVVSSTLVEPHWNNSTVLKGEVVDEVSKLKQELDGKIVVYASFQLVRTLMEHDLVDELRLMVYPVVPGAGERLFGETSDKKPMRLLDTRTVGDGLAYLTYQLVGSAGETAGL